MGAHSGAVSGVIDVNERPNVAGAGINVARRAMDCGDAGHILLSQHVADDLEQYGRIRAGIPLRGDPRLRKLSLRSRRSQKHRRLTGACPQLPQPCEV
jgi:class 3 adenylate cyclase